MMASPTFDLGHLNDLNGDVEEALKLSIFVVQKASAPIFGLEFRQGSIGTIRSSLATSYNVARRRATLGVGSYSCSCCCCSCDRGKTKSTPTLTN